MRRILALAIILALAAAAALVLGLAVGGQGRSFRGSRPPAGITLPDFVLPSVDGPLVRSRDLRGKAVVVTFLESKCRAACPLVAFQVARGLRLLPPHDRARVAALAVSVHPGDDTPPSVRAFLRRQRAEGEITYLVGSERRLRPVWRAFGVLSALDTGDANLHSVPVRIFDRDGVWVSTLHAGSDLTPANLRHDLFQALSS